jgi:REP-associated tyrosine transposase
MIIGGVEDHVHALFALSKNHALIKIVEEVKKGSSKWMKTATDNLDFHWQNGYAAFSVSRSNESTVHQYIQYQEEHHRKRSYEEELRALLELNQVPFDERYVWD